MNALLQEFLRESRDALEQIASTLLAMERSPQDTGYLVELFRLVHTLKGNSGLFDFPALTQVLHAAEEVMDAVRSETLGFSQALADALLEAADYAGSFLDQVERQGQPGAAFASAPQALVQSLRGLLGPGARAPAPAAASAAPTPLPIELCAQGREALRQALAAGQPVMAVDYRPAADCFFQGSDPLHLVRQLPGVLWRRIGARQAWPEGRTLDAYQCNLRLQMLVMADAPALAEHFRYVSEQVDWRPLSHADLEPGATTAAPGSVQTSLGALSLEVLHIQQRALLACATQPWPSGQHQAIARTLRNLVAAEGDTQLAESLEAALAAARQGADPAPLLAWLAQQLATPHAPAAASGDQLERWLSEQLGNPPPAPASEPAGRSDSPRGEDSAGTAGARILKVEQEKIDRLMNLIGEVVVAKNGLPYLAERAEAQYAQRELAREIKAQYAVINRIAEDLQDAIMQVRMMPVSFVMQRFPRLVRDIARKLEKKVELLLEGEETEADKTIIEALADPLVHIVRNALDHGLESPAERLAAGKPETGMLRMRTSQSADHVLILIEDDGRGIDPQKIKHKVAASGLLEPASLDALSDQELINLVFLPGLSTAEQVSELSGRGVGMDVVRAGIERVGGQLRLSSEPGRGTRLSLSLPLSMAITQVMVIESAGQRFGIPMDQVMETVRLPAAAIHTIKQQPTAQLRGRTIPLKGLNQLLALDCAQRLNEDQEHALMVLRSRGELVGLLIDDFHGSVDIILKPMLGILGELSGYSGTAVMGDGSILMILNPMELFE